MEGNEDYDLPTNYPSLVRNKENVKFVLDAMFKFKLLWNFIFQN